MAENYKLKYTGQEIDSLLDKANNSVSASDLNDAIAGIDIPDVPEIVVDTAPSVTSNNSVSNKAITGLVQTTDRYNEPIVAEGSPVALSLDLPLTTYEKDKIVKLSAKNLPTVITWTEHVTGATSFQQGICYGGGQYVIVGTNGMILTSPDGESWTQQTSGVTATLNSVCYGNGIYVAVGSNGVILTSLDAIIWTQQTAVGNSHPIVRFINGIFMLGWGGDNTYYAIIWTSIDGVTWTKYLIKTKSNYAAIHNFCYGNGMYVAVGGRGTILTSPTGTNWTQQTSGITNDLYGVCYGNGTYVAVGANGVVLTSGDGVTWTYSDLNYNITGLYDICFAEGQFIAVGYYNVSPYESYILKSTDAINWQDTYSNAGQTRKICFANNQFSVISHEPMILTCPLTITAYENPTLNINGLGAKIINGTIKNGNYYSLIYNGSSWDIQDNSTTFNYQEVVKGETIFNLQKSFKCGFIGLVDNNMNAKIVLPNSEIILLEEIEDKKVIVSTTDTTISIINSTDNVHAIIYNIIE